MAATVACRLNDVGSRERRRLAVSPARHLASCRSVLPEHPAHPPPGHGQDPPDVIDAASPARRARWFGWAGLQLPDRQACSGARQTSRAPFSHRQQRVPSASDPVRPCQAGPAKTGSGQRPAGARHGPRAAGWDSSGQGGDGSKRSREQVNWLNRTKDPSAFASVAGLGLLVPCPGDRCLSCGEVEAWRPCLSQAETWCSPVPGRLRAQGCLPGAASSGRGRAAGGPGRRVRRWRAQLWRGRSHPSTGDSGEPGGRPAGGAAHFRQARSARSPRLPRHSPRPVRPRRRHG